MIPLHVEDLLSMLDDHSTWAVAGYNGSCDRVINHKGLVKLLQEKAGKDAQHSISSAEIDAMNKDGINKVFGKIGAPQLCEDEGCPQSHTEHVCFSIPEGMTMTHAGESYGTYAAFRVQGWTDEQMLCHGFMRASVPALGEVAEEIRNARANWPAFNSAHEGFTVLEKMGYQLEHIKSKRVIIRDKGHVIYFVLGTGAWNCVAPVRASGRGIHNLIHFISTGEVISRESIEAKYHERSV